MKNPFSALASGLSGDSGRLVDPYLALPMAAALIGGNGNSGGMSNALMAGMYGMQARRENRDAQAQRNQTVDYLNRNRPDLAEAYAAGVPMNVITQELFKKPDERKMVKSADGTYRYVDDGSQVFEGIEPRNSGFEITTADGTTIRQGVFGNQDKKNVANRVTDAQDLASSASQLKQVTSVLRNANQGTGYSGPGGELYGKTDDFLSGALGLDILPGNSRDRQIMRSGGLDVALEKVAKTKGAISNAEMELFMAASPGLRTTQEGNAALFDMLDAVADRMVERADSMERWRQQYGTLDGFENEWNRYIKENPLIVESGGGIQLRKTGTNVGSGETVIDWSEL